MEASTLLVSTSTEKAHAALYADAASRRKSRTTATYQALSEHGYTLGDVLGKGGFAKCWEFINADTDYVHAAKIIQKSSLTKSRAK